jgi:hypothetical protein
MQWRGGLHIELWWENQKERPRCMWEDNIKMHHKEIG